MRAIITVILICGLFGCQSHGFSKKPPKEIEVEKPEKPPTIVTPIETPKPAPVEETIEFAKAKDMIFAQVDGDACSKESYKDQGKAPKSYHRGISLTYAKVICDTSSEAFKIGSQPLGSPEKDALAHYGLKPETAYDRLNTTVSMMIGSNARESSWRPCVGRDVSAKASDVKACINGGGETCEAGLDQKSYNAIGKTGPQRDLFNAYLDYPKGCFRSDYYGTITCSAANWKNHGSDKMAVTFQKLQKECPGYTVESGIIGFRTLRKHWGPLNRKTAEVKKTCTQRFAKLHEFIVANPGICKALK